MKKIITIFIILLLGQANCHALQTNIPQKPFQTQEIQFKQNQNDNFLSMFFEFIGGIFNRLTGKHTGAIIKSQDVTRLSDTIKTYQSQEESTDPNYENSHTKDKTDFGTGILDIIAGILKIFE